MYKRQAHLRARARDGRAVAAPASFLDHAPGLIRRLARAGVHVAPTGRLELGRDAATVSVPRPALAPNAPDRAGACLLYTSAAADERSSVDLGGRRSLKKKKKICPRGRRVN